MKVQCIPAKIHNTPEKIPEAVQQLIQAAKLSYSHIYVAFADCGTGGLLDRVLEQEQVERLPGAHCYEFYAGSEAFAILAEQELGTFYLTDFLARHFDRLIMEELGIHKHPELKEMYFGNYKKLVYLAQSDNPELMVMAQDAAKQLDLTFEFHRTDYGDLETGLTGFNEQVIQWQN